MFHGAYMDEFHVKSFLVNAILFCLFIILDLSAAYSLSASTHCSGVVFENAIGGCDFFIQQSRK